jgi:hypothetical protein
MATVGDLSTRVRSFLDDDSSSSERYGLTTDILPAMNSAISYLVAVFSAAFDSKQIKPEVLTNLIKTELLDSVATGVVAKVDLSSVMADGSVWRILGIEPNPTITEGEGEDPDTLSISLGKMASRLSLEEWNHAQENPFMRGSTASMPSIFEELAYTGPGRFFGDDKDYILLRPASIITDDKVVLYYLESPTTLTALGNTIQFPPTLHNLIVQKTIQYLSYQHSKDAKYFQITDKDIKEVIGLMNI